MTDHELAEVIVSASTAVPEEILAEFRNTLMCRGLSVDDERRPEAAFAGIEWALPTVVVLFLSRKLFDSFMAEAGKDLYQLVKRAMVRLANRTTGPDREVRVACIGTPGKVSDREPAVLSVYVRLDESQNIKLIFTHDLLEQSHSNAVSALLDAIAEHYERDESVLAQALAEAELKLGGVIPFKFDVEQGLWRPLRKDEVA